MTTTAHGLTFRLHRELDGTCYAWLYGGEFDNTYGEGKTAQEAVDCLVFRVRYGNIRYLRRRNATLNGESVKTMRPHSHFCGGGWTFINDRLRVNAILKSRGVPTTTKMGHQLRYSSLFIKGKELWGSSSCISTSESLYRLLQNGTPTRP